MTNLLVASLAFLLLHRLVSGSPLRARIVAQSGERRFVGCFALASLVSLAWLGVGYATAGPPYREPLWGVPRALWAAQFFLQPLAMVLIVSGLLSPNPGTVGQEKTVDRTDIVQGALRITRHPFLWGTVLLAAGHMAVVPSPRSLLLFGTLAVVALTGTFSIDAKRQQRLGARWSPFAATTSNLPFAAILAGRQHLSLSELSVKAILLSLVLSIATLLAHPALWRLLLTV